MPKQKKTVDVDEIVAGLPRTEQVIVKRLRALIMDCIPHATEKTYYDFHIPFYTHNKLICFLWPPSLSGEGDADAKKRHEKGVALGFNQGHLMANNHLLLAEGRKQVRVTYFKHINDVDEPLVRSLLYEAALVDEAFAKKKKRRRE